MNGTVHKPTIWYHGKTLFSIMSDAEAIALVNAHGFGDRSPARAVTRLVNEANERWIREEDGVVDDTTVTIAFLHQWQPESGAGTT